MTITLYNNLSDDRTVQKNITTIATIENAKPVDPFDILNPVFIFNYSGDYNNNINYVYCAETLRYYTITGITFLTGGRVQISCTVDVLMTYANSIRSLTALCVRNENKQNPYLKDNLYPVTVKTKQRVIEFSENPFTITDLTPQTTNCFIMNIAGLA